MEGFKKQNKLNSPIILDASIMSALLLVTLIFIFNKAPLSKDKVLRNIEANVKLVQVYYKQQQIRQPKPAKPDIGQVVDDDQEIIDEVEVDVFEVEKENLKTSIADFIFPEEDDESYGIWNVEVKPKLLSKVLPVYPKMAIRNRIEGTVFASFIIERDGSVSNIEIVKGNKLLHKAAIDAIRAYKFSPAFQGDNPVRVKYQVPIWFRLNK